MEIFTRQLFYLMLSSTYGMVASLYYT